MLVTMPSGFKGRFMCIDACRIAIEVRDPLAWVHQFRIRSSLVRKAW